MHCRLSVEEVGRGQETLQSWSLMKKGLHPALQWISLITPQGRLVRVLSAKVFKSDKPFYIRDPGKKAEAEGPLAKFKKKYDLPTTSGAGDNK